MATIEKPIGSEEFDFGQLRFAMKELMRKEGEAKALSHASSIVESILRENPTPTHQNFLLKAAEETISMQDLDDFWMKKLNSLTHERRSATIKAWAESNGNIKDEQKRSLIELSNMTQQQEQEEWQKRHKRVIDLASDVFDNETEWQEANELITAIREACKLSKDDILTFWREAAQIENLSSDVKSDLEGITTNIEQEEDSTVAMMGQSWFYDYIHDRNSGIGLVMKELKGPFIITDKQGNIVKAQSPQDFITKVAHRDSWPRQRNPELSLQQIETIETPIGQDIRFIVNQATNDQFDFEIDGGHITNKIGLHSAGEIIATIRDHKKNPNGVLIWNEIMSHLRELSPEIDLDKEADIAYVAKGRDYPPQRFVFPLGKDHLVVDLPNPRGYQDAGMLIMRGDIDQFVNGTYYQAKFDQKAPITLNKKLLSEYRENDQRIVSEIY